MVHNARMLRRPAGHLDLLEPRRLLSANTASEVADNNGIGLPATLVDGIQAPTLSELHQQTGVRLVHEQFGFTGHGQTVVIVDSGVAYDHEALGGGLGSGHRVVGGWDFTEENDANPYDDGPGGFHGTHVAGIIGSSDSVHLGVAPEVDIVALRVFNDQGRGQMDWLESALDWVADNVDTFEHPITAVNLSIGTNWNSLSLPEYAALEDELATLRSAGVFVAVAAGNYFDAEIDGLSYPAVSPQVVPVASHGADGVLSSFSQRDVSVIAAPGENIVSTVPDYVEDFNGRTDDFYAASGTSMAAPYLTGASVLLRQALQAAGDDDIHADAIHRVLADTADTIFDQVTGKTYRLLNLAAAVKKVMASTTNPLPTVPAEVDLGRLTEQREQQIAFSDSGTTVTFTPESTGLWSVEWGSDLAFQIDAGSGATQVRAETQIDVRAGQTVRIDLPAGQGQLYISPRIVQQGGQLIVQGTSDDDTITIDQAGFIRLNGNRWSFEPGEIDLIRVVGGPGDDSLAVESRFPDSQISLSVGSASVVSSDAEVQAGGFERVEVFAHAADAHATFFDSVGSDQFFAKSTHSWMNSGRFLNYVRGAETVVAWGSGDTDKAVFYDSAGNDNLLARPGSVSLQSNSLDVHAFGFPQFVMRAWQGGHDQATLIGSGGDDRLRITPEATAFDGDGFYYFVEQVDQLAIHGNGGYDSATLRDSDGDDRLTMRPGEQTLVTPAAEQQLFDFSRVEAFASAGTDTVSMQGSMGSDLFTAKPTHSWMNSGDLLNYARGFDSVQFDGAGGSDTATLYDSPQVDAFQLGALQAVVSSVAFQVDVYAAESIRAISQHGNDVARFFGLRDNDDLFSTDSIAWVKQPGYTTIAEGFARVTAENADPTTDLAIANDGTASALGLSINEDDLLRLAEIHLSSR